MLVMGPQSARNRSTMNEECHYLFYLLIDRSLFIIYLFKKETKKKDMRYSMYAFYYPCMPLRIVEGEE
jgi:hypothetical protein